MIGVQGELFLIVVLLIINIVMCAKRIPIAGVPISIFTIYMSLVYFINMTTDQIPANPYTTLLLTIVAICALMSNAMELARN